MDKILKYLFKALVLFVIFMFMAGIGSCTLLDKRIVDKQYIQKLSEDNSSASIENDFLRQQIQVLEEEIAELATENEDLRQDLEDNQALTEGLNAEISGLKKRIEEFDYDQEIATCKSELEDLKSLLDNLNDLLANVYIGTTEPEMNYSFTAFSIQHDGRSYIITAGHCVNDNLGQDARFKFKANFSDSWIYPELIGYKAASWDLDDYAVFYSDEISGGLEIGGELPTKNYLLGSIDKGLSMFRYIGDSSIRGESGSPVINIEGKAVGIYVVYGTEYTPIELAIGLIEDSHSGS